MDSRQRRQTRVGRWGPLALYGLIVLTWFIDGVVAGAGERLWLGLWTVPAAALYLWRTGRWPG